MSAFIGRAGDAAYPVADREVAIGVGNHPDAHLAGADLFGWNIGLVSGLRPSELGTLTDGPILADGPIPYL